MCFVLFCWFCAPFLLSVNFIFVEIVFSVNIFFSKVVQFVAVCIFSVANKMQGVKPKHCCVPDCSDLISRRHRFPRNNPELFDIWIGRVKHPRFVNLTQEQIYKTYVICERHFDQKYIVPGTKKGISQIAIPSLHLLDGEPSNEDHHPSASALSVSEEMDKLSFLNEDNRVTQEHQATTSRGIELVANPKGHERRSVLNVFGLTRQAHLSPKLRKIYHIVKDYSQKTSYYRNKVTSLKLRLNRAEKELRNPTFRHILKAVNNVTYKFLMMQIRNQSLPAKGHRFTIDEKILSLTLLKSSGRAYNILSKFFCLPSRRTLSNLLCKVPLECGINENMWNNLQGIVTNMPIMEKDCLLIFDEMSITPMLQYNQGADKIEGFEDFGDGCSKQFADHVNVFMVKGIYRQWKQPIAFTFSNGPIKSNRLTALIKIIIIKLFNIGLNVVSIICDQGSSNSAAIKKLYDETNEKYAKNGKENTNFGFEINGHEIIPLYDPPHLIKGIRNNLLTKNLHFCLKGKQRVAKWNHNEQFYNLDMAEDIRICPKLHDGHIYVNKMNKMKVSTCMQVFSHQVGSLMLRISKWDIQCENKLSREAEDTAELILFIDELFDSINANSKIAPASKPLKGGVTNVSNHEEFWRDAVEIVQGFKYNSYNKRSNKYTLAQPPSIKNLITMLNGFIHIKQKLLHKNYKYILTRAFNQDALENFFGCIRSHGARNTSPDVVAFKKSFKSLIINNFMAYHSPGTNCEEDFSDGALDNFRNFICSNSTKSTSTVIIDDTTHHSMNLMLDKRSKVSKSTTVYIAGYVTHRLLKLRNNCAHCRNILLYREGNECNDDFIEARQYTKASLKKPGTFVTFLTNSCLSIMFYVLPQICNKNNVSMVIQQTIKSKLNLAPLKCPNHFDNGELYLNILSKCIIHFYVKQINLILKGRNSKFAQCFVNAKDQTNLDPLKVTAHKKYLKRKAMLKKK